MDLPNGLLIFRIQADTVSKSSARMAMVLVTS